ncbi:MAG: AHH domain-containing protein [Erythrobacter sp.]
MPPGGHNASRRTAIAFTAVNARGTAGYDPALQRHHLLPRQLLSERCFGRMFAALGRGRVGFDDFRCNGLLLPAREDASLRTGMPLHRGPHRRYNEVVIARVGRIEARWAIVRVRDEEAALAEALLRLQLLQGALRRQLMAERRRIKLNRKDPVGTGFDFTELDAMAEMLWGAE